MKKSILYVFAAAIWGIPGDCRQVLQEDRLFGGESIDLAGFSGTGMDSDRIHDVSRDSPEAHPADSLCISASFYSGLGPMLVVAAIRFIRFMMLQSSQP